MKDESNLILGIDPGYASCGYGIITKDYQYPIVKIWGCIKTTPKTGDSSIRLLEIYQKIEELIQYYGPTSIAIEKLFFARNTTTALQVSEARGVILLAAAKNKIPVYEYTPKQVKLAITGSGNADKKQMQVMITRLLHLTEIPKPDDAADGLSIALCHMNWIREIV